MKNLTVTQKRKKKQGKCICRRCTNQSAPESNYCHKHIRQRWAQSNPEKHKYFVLKYNAKRRGKEFTLTFEEFMDFLKENPEYMKKSGTTVKSLQIDRIDVDKGYTKDNIQCITLAENVWKQHNVDYADCPF